MRYLLCSAAVAALAVASSATAQESAAAAAPAAAPDQVVEEVVVTAQRREETLKTVPATISAVTASQLEAAGPLTSTGDLLKTVPGVRFNDLQSTNLSEVSIRGSGTQRATGADSGVGLFVNGAYVGSSTLGGRNFKNIDFFDLERVEVLEGPQGALYGRNSEFGVVNIVSAKPKFNDSGYVNATYTDGIGQTKVMGVLNKQLNDNVAVRVGAQNIEQSNGWFYDPKHDRFYDHTDGWLGRAQVRFSKDKLDVTFLVDAQDMNLPTFLNTYTVIPGTVAAIPLGFNQSRYVVAHEGKDGVHQQTYRGMILANYDMGWGQLSSTTMSTHWTSDQNYAAAIDTAQETEFQKSGQLGIYPFSQVTTRAQDETFYQDLHVAGNALGDKVGWLFGADYLHQNDFNGIDTYNTPCVFALGRGICSGTPSQHLCFLPLPTSTPCPAIYPASFGTSSRSPLQNRSEAVYGQVRYMTGPLTLSGELRYSHDEKEASQTTYLLFTNTNASAPASYSFASNRLNYTFNASYKLPNELPGGIVYFKVGTGYRAGGVNARASSPFAPNPFQPTYGNEDTTSYELGYKGNLAKNIYFRLSGYASQTKNAITSINDGCTVVNACGQAGVQFNVNGGTVEARGIEAAIDGRFDVAGGLLLVSLNGGHQHAKYVDVPTDLTGLPIVGTSVAQLPEWTSSATINYRHPITVDLTGFGNFTYQGQNGGVQDAVTAAAPAIYLNSLDFINLRGGVDYKRLQLALFVQNAANKQIALLQFQTGGFPLANRYSNPRTAGVNISYRW